MKQPLLLLGYVTGAIMLVAGLLILIGVLRFGENGLGGSPTIEKIFGLVVMLYGGYRLASTYSARNKRG